MDALLLIWTVLLKGVNEVKLTSLAFETLEVLIIRAIYIQGIQSQHSSTQIEKPQAAQQPTFKNKYTPTSFAEVVELFKKKKEPLIANYLFHDVGLVRFAEGCLELSEYKKDTQGLRNQIAPLLKKYTQSIWEVIFSTETAEPSLAAQQDEKTKQKKEKALQSDVAQTASTLFPGAKITVN